MSTMSKILEPYDPRVAETFDEIYDSISTVIEFNPKWRWGDSIRGAIYDLANKLKLEGSMSVKTVDDLGRKVIFMPTPLGSVTLFVKPTIKGRRNVHYEVPEVFCEQNLFVRASDKLALVSLQHIVSLEFAQVMAEVANGLENS